MEAAKAWRFKANRLRAAGVTDRIRALFDLDQFDIDVSDDNRRLVATVDGETYGYHELGSGLNDLPRWK